MAQSLSVARARAIAELQKIRDRRPVGSFEHAVADYAIDLVMNETRAEDAFLVWNALKDARSTLIRKKRRDLERNVGLEAIEKLEGTALTSPSASLCASPEAQLAWSDGYRRLKAWADARSSRTGVVLDDWRDGLSGAQSARARRLSDRTIDTERQGLRRAATRLFSEAA